MRGLLRHVNRHLRRELSTSPFLVVYLHEILFVDVLVHINHGGREVLLLLLLHLVELVSDVVPLLLHGLEHLDVLLDPPVIPEGPGSVWEGLSPALAECGGRDADLKSSVHLLHLEELAGDEQLPLARLSAQAVPISLRPVSMILPLDIVVVLGLGHNGRTVGII